MPSSAIPILFGSKLKLAYTSTLMGVSAASVPSAFVVYTRSSPRNAFTREGFASMLSTLDAVPQFFGETAPESGKGLRGQYVGVWNNVEGAAHNPQTHFGDLKGQMQRMEDKSKEAKKYLSDNGKDINYYAFVLNPVVKATFRMLATILRDTMVHASKESLSEQMLSIQKMAVVGYQKAFKSFGEGLVNLYKKHHSVLKNMSAEDGVAMLKILREVPLQEYHRFMTRITANLSKVNQKNPSDYSKGGSRQILKEVFVGEDEMNNLKDRIDEVTNELSDDSIKDPLSEILGDSGIDLESVKSALEQLSTFVSGLSRSQ